MANLPYKYMAYDADVFLYLQHRIVMKVEETLIER